MEHPSSLRPAETARRATDRSRRTLSSRELAVKVCVASIAAVVLGRLGPVAAAGGVVVSLVVESAIESLVRRLRKRTLWGVALLALLLGRADRAVAATGKSGRRTGPAALSAVVAAAIVVVGITAPEAALGHALLADRGLTFFGGEQQPAPAPPAPRIRVRRPPAIVGERHSPQAQGRRRHVRGVPRVSPPRVGVTHAHAPRPTATRPEPKPVPEPKPAPKPKQAPKPKAVPKPKPAAAAAPASSAVPAPPAKDTTAPQLTVPTGTVPAEAAVPFAFDTMVHATDDVDGSVTPTCTPSSPALFSIGSHEVECTATDAAGNSKKATFTVLASDHTPPTLTVPTAPFTAEAATSFAFTAIVSAVDAVDGPVPVSCRPASGSVVSLGEHRVVCHAVDAAGNSSSGTFTLVGADTTKPVVTVPRSWTGTAGTPVPSAAVPVTATDTVDGTVKATCSPAAIPRGGSTITCTATDRAGNVGSASFPATGIVRG